MNASQKPSREGIHGFWTSYSSHPRAGKSVVMGGLWKRGCWPRKRGSYQESSSWNEMLAFLSHHLFGVWGAVAASVLTILAYAYSIYPCSSSSKSRIEQILAGVEKFRLFLVVKVHSILCVTQQPQPWELPVRWMCTRCTREEKKQQKSLGRFLSACFRSWGDKIMLHWWSWYTSPPALLTCRSSAYHGFLSSMEVSCVCR